MRKRRLPLSWFQMKVGVPDLTCSAYEATPTTGASGRLLMRMFCLVGNDVYHINVFVLLVVVLTCSTKDYPSLARAQHKWPRLVCV